MIGHLRRAWSWFVGGLTDTWLLLSARLVRVPVYRLETSGDTGLIRGPNGAQVGRLLQPSAAERFAPASLAKRLTGCAFDIVAPPNWLFRRALDPAPAQSAPFLDAYVRHQIDRVTPWRAGDVYYHLSSRPLPDDANRLSVELSVLPKRLVQGILAALDPLHPRRIRIVAEKATPGGAVVISVVDEIVARSGRARRGMAIVLFATAFAFAAAFLFVLWEARRMAREIEGLEEEIANQKAFVAAAARRGNDRPEQALQARSIAHPKSVELIDALSAALPDDAYLSELTIEQGRLKLSGISTNAPGLVPALEKSGRFADVRFSAATTKVESGSGDRFHLEMRATPASTGALSR